MEFLDTVLGALIAAGAWWVGRRTARQETPYKEPEPICGCGHHYSYHREGGACAHDGRGRYNKQTQRYENRCTCQKYTGPEPLPTYIP